MATSRAQRYPQPYLAQTVPLLFNVGLGVLRLNRGYGGATVRVRRASDNAELDCYSQADIVAHCAGTNGFVRRAYSQQGTSARDYQQATAGLQPKCFDSATGLVKLGSVPCVLGDGVGTRLEITPAANTTCGFSGDCSFTTATLIRNDNPSAAAISTAYQWGHVGTAALGAVFQQERDVVPRFVQHYSGSANSFAPPNPGFATPHWQTFTRSNANPSGSTVCRENGNTIPQTIPAVGAVNVESTKGSFWLAEFNQDLGNVYSHFWQGPCALLLGWSDGTTATALSGQPASSLEQFLNALRQQ